MSPPQPKTGAAARARLRLLQRAWWGRDGAFFVRGAATARVGDRSVSRIWRELVEVVAGYETVKPAGGGWLDWGGVLTAASKESVTLTTAVKVRACFSASIP